MKKAALPSNEKERLKKLRDYEVLDSPNDPRLDQITNAVANICGTKIALISLIDSDRQWFKSAHGLKASETPRDISFCGHAILGEDIFEIQDAKLDERFCDNPLLLGEPHVRFYAGMPLITSDKLKIGTLCVIDSEPKKLSDEQRLILKAFANSVVENFELRLKNKQLDFIRLQYQDVQSMVQAGAWDLDVASGQTIWSDHIYSIYNIPLGTPVSKVDGISFYAPHERERISNLVTRCITEKEDFDQVFEFYDSVGTRKWVRAIGRPIVSEDNKVNRVLGTFQDVTEMISNKLRLEAILDFSPVCVYECQINKSWTMNYINPYIEKITGYRDVDLIEDSTLSFADLIHPDDRKYVEEEVLAAVKLNQSYNITYRLVNRNGSIHWIWEKGAKAPEGDTLIGVIFDITDKRMAEEEMNKFFELSLNYMAIFSDDGSIKKLNHAWQELGYSLEELKTQRYLDFIHSEDINSTNSEIAKLRSGQKMISFENRCRRKDGSYIRLQWAASADPETGLFFATATDVTERHRREEINLLLSHLRSKFIELSGNRHDFFEYLLERVLSLTKSEYGFIGDVLEDESGKYLKTVVMTDISWNKATKELFEQSSAQGLEFRNLKTLFGEVITSGEVLIANDALNHPKAAGIPEGHPALKSFMGIPLHYNGQIFAMIGVANNPHGYMMDDYLFLKTFFELIGEMINSIKLSSELEFQKKITFHNAKLASIGQLAAGVGHEINNPLAIILGQLEMMKDRHRQLELKDQMLATRIEKMFMAVDRISNITKGLRAFARVDESQLSVMNIETLLFETKEMLKEIYAKESIVIDFEVQKELFVRGNRGRLQQVIVNILTNARDALQHSERKTISIRGSLVDKKVKIVISDTGPGVAPEIRSKIFDPFFTTKEVNEGTGIGLALVSSIVQEHGGFLSLAEAAGGGAEFVITLDAFVSSGGNQSLSHSNSRPALQQKGRVLLVEDEEDLRDVMVYLLESGGVEVVAASNGKEGLEYVKQNAAKIDLIICDMKMPLMSGPELARAIKDLGIYKGNFLFITGGINVELDDYRGLVDGVITKPFDQNKILSLVKEWIKKKPS